MGKDSFLRFAPIVVVAGLLAGCAVGGPAPKIDPIHAAIQGAKAMDIGAKATLTLDTCPIGIKPTFKHICVEQKVKDGINKGLPFLEAGIAAASAYDTGGTADQKSIDAVQEIISKAITDYTKAGGR